MADKVFSFGVEKVNGKLDMNLRFCRPRRLLTDDEQSFIVSKLSNYGGVEQARFETDGRLVVRTTSPNGWAPTVHETVGHKPKYFKDLYDYIQDLGVRAQLQHMEHALEDEAA